MIDIRAARNDPDGFRSTLARKGAADAFDELIAADRAVLDVQPRVEELRGKRKLKGKPTPEQLAELEQVKTELQQLENQLADAETRRKDILDRIPNPPAEDTPDGFTDEDAVEIRRVGEPPAFDFPVKDHLDLAQVFGWIDMERAAKVSGSRFAYRSATSHFSSSPSTATRSTGSRRRASFPCCRRCSSARRRCTAPGSSRTTR